jgi:hypothetical protein
MQFIHTHNTSLEEFKTKAELDTIKYYQHIYLSLPKRRQQANVILRPKETIKEMEELEYLPIEPALVDENNKPHKY